MSDLTTSDLTAYLSGNEDAALAAGVGAVRAYCGWRIAPTGQETVTVYPCDSAVLLPTLKLVSLDAVTRDGEPVDLTGVDARENGVVYGLPMARPLVVTFTHGYEEWPATARRAALSLAAAAATPGAGRLVRVQVGQINEQYESGASGESGVTDTVALLAPYKLPPRP